MGNLIIKKYDDDIKKFLGNDSSKNKLTRHISRYIQMNSEQLNHNAPIYRIPFNKNGADTSVVFDATKINSREMQKDIKGISDLRKYADVLKDPLFFTLTMIIKNYDTKSRMTSNEQKDFNMILMYLTLSMYWSIQYRQFNFEPNDNVAQYTLNRLSNKFYFKKYKTVSKALLVTAIQNNENFKGEYSSDEDIMKYIMSLRTRVSNLVINFSKEMYKDIEAGNYLNASFSSNDEDNFVPEGTNVSGIVSDIGNKTITNFTQSRINNRLLRMSCNMTSTSPSIMQTTLDDIRDNEIESVRQLIINIVSVYIEGRNNPIESVGSTRFLRESIAIYSKSNTTNKKIIEIKNILDIFLKKYNSKYNQTEREATKNNYRRTLFIYFVLLISDTY